MTFGYQRVLRWMIRHQASAQPSVVTRATDINSDPGPRQQFRLDVIMAPVAVQGTQITIALGYKPGLRWLSSPNCNCCWKSLLKLSCIKM